MLNTAINYLLHIILFRWGYGNEYCAFF